MTLKTARTVLLATAFAIGGASYGMAQSSPAPANQSGGGTSATTQSPTDLSKTGDNTMGQPATKGMTNGMTKSKSTTKGMTKNEPAAGARHTTGSGSHSGMNNSMNRGRSAAGAKTESLEKTKSPASHDSGVKQQK